jgi:Squalene/phytoene synthase
MPGSTALRRAIAEIAAAASAHLRMARRQPRPAAAALPALLPAVVAEHSLKRLQRAGYDPFNPALARPDPLQSWRLAAAVLAHRLRVRRRQRASG